MHAWSSEANRVRGNYTNQFCDNKMEIMKGLYEKKIQVQILRIKCVETSRRNVAAYRKGSEAGCDVGAEQVPKLFATCSLAAVILQIETLTQEPYIISELVGYFRSYHGFL